jgi:lysozyme family protein
MKKYIPKSSFVDAFRKNIINKDGYLNNLDNGGGESYKGILRKNDPNWYGWEIIDFHKHDPYFPNSLNDTLRLQNEVEDFFKDKYWDTNKLDEFSQVLAEEIFIIGLNIGVDISAKFLQKALNYLNKDGVLYDELIVDGNVDKKTLEAINSLNEKGGDEKALIEMVNTLQRKEYMGYMNGDPTEKKHARGWFSRVTV